MRMIKLDRTAVGKQLAQTIHSADGRVLLHSGVVLTENYIHRLLVKGFRSAYIQDEFTRGIVVEDIVREQTRLEAMQAVKEVMEKHDKGYKTDGSRIKASVNALLAELQGNHGLLAGLSSIRSFDDYTFAHSVNVCTLSLILGISLYYDYDRLYELGVGAILHDIGKTLMPLTILQKQTALNEGEWEVIKKHADYGFDILRQNLDISLLSAHIAFQHHEKFNGHGYPRGLKGDEILEIARVAAIADVYDAITNDRVYRVRLPLNQAYNVILQSAGSHFDRRLVLRFLDRVLLFPNGTIVKLNNGQIGIIAGQEEKFNSRPQIRVITDTQQRLQDNWEEIRLLDRPELEIREIMDDYPFPVPFSRPVGGASMSPEERKEG